MVVGGEGGEDGDVLVLEEQADERGVHALDVADEAVVHEPPLARLGVQDLGGGALRRVEDVAVHAGQPDGRDALPAQRGEDVGVDLPGEDHLRHVERRLVGDPAAADHYGLEAQAALHLGRLRPAAVDQDDADAHVRQERDVARERAQRLRVRGDLAPELHHHRALLVVAEVGQRLL